MAKQGAVGGALDKSIIEIKKHVGLPVEGNPGVRATVFIHIKLVLPVDNKQVDAITITRNSKFLGGFGGKIDNCDYKYPGHTYIKRER